MTQHDGPYAEKDECAKCLTCGDPDCEIDQHGPNCGCAGCYIQYRLSPAEQGGE